MKPMLIVIDMQEGFRYPAPEAMVKRLEHLIQSFKGPVVFMCFRHQPGSMFEREINWKKFQDEESQRIYRELEPLAHVRMWHETYGIITPELLKFIQKNQIDKVFLAGVYTDVSIAKSTMDFFDQGISCAVVDDCCATQHQVTHMEIMGSIRRQIGHHNVVKSTNLFNP